MSIKWNDDETALNNFVAWIKGQTGYAAVDASMGQIAKIGWMHNRSRMMVASILTKNLGVNWRWGQDYFRYALLDLDESANNGGWQWAASVGADPKPIRIFNPYLQSDNYDSEFLYQKKWLPKDSYRILNIKNKQILEYKVRPIIEHKVARNQALIRYGLENQVARDY